MRRKPWLSEEEYNRLPRTPSRSRGGRDNRSIDTETKVQADELLDEINTLIRKLRRLIV